MANDDDDDEEGKEKDKKGRIDQEGKDGTVDEKKSASATDHDDDENQETRMRRRRLYPSPISGQFLLQMVGVSMLSYTLTSSIRECATS